MPKLLWVDLTSKLSKYCADQALLEDCEIHRQVNPDGIEESIRSLRPDVLCFDFDHPHQRGLSLVAWTLQSHPDLPAVLFTEHSSEGLATWAFRAGIGDYFVKPLSKSDLLPRLEHLVCRRSSHAAGLCRRLPIMPPSIGEAPTRAKSAPASGTATVPAARWVEAHYSEKLTSEAAAMLCGMAPFQFSRAFKAAHGVTFKTFLLNYRMEKARELLRRPGAAVGDVAFAVGFHDVSYFARVFRRLVGVPATAYRSKACRA